MIISKPCHHISSVPFFLAYVDSFPPPAYIRMPGFHNVGRIDIHIGIDICGIDPLPCNTKKYHQMARVLIKFCLQMMWSHAYILCWKDMKKCRIFKLGWHLAHRIQIPILKFRILISQFLFVSIKNQSDWKRNQENAGFIIVSELVAGFDEYHFRIGKY